MAMQRDWASVRAAVEASVAKVIDTLFEGNDAEALAVLLAEIGPAMAMAVQREQPDKVEEIKAQLEGLLEIVDLRVRQGSQEAAISWMNTGLDAIYGVSIASLKSMKVV